jgi:porphobilinogen deaminase
MRLTALALKNTTDKDELSQSLIVNTDVKQGDLLSELLFSVIMDQFLKSLDIRGNISTRLKEVCAYANDILLMARKQQALADTFIGSIEGRASN